jgi:membrane protease YdiL (CAAX protease family)
MVRITRTTRTIRGDPLNPKPEGLASSSAGSPTQPPSSSASRRIFFGPDGLRAGWSLLLFFLIFAAIAFSLFHIARAIHHPPASPSKNSTISLTATFLSDGIPLAILLLVTWIMSRIERRPFSAYGLRGTRKLPNFLAGLATGLVFLSLLAFLLWKSGFLIVDGRALFGNGILRYGIAWLAAFLLIAVFEEFLFRGYIQYTLARGLAGLYRAVFKTRHSEALGFWTAAVFWAFTFGLIHKGNPGESPIGLLCAGLASLLFAFSLWRTGSLWWAIGLHTTWDYAQSFLYGVGDSGVFMRQHLLNTHPAGRLLLSGGATGPEGSLFVLPIMALIVLVIVLTLPHTRRDYASSLPTHPIKS